MLESDKCLDAAKTLWRSSADAKAGVKRWRKQFRRETVKIGLEGNKLSGLLNRYLDTCVEGGEEVEIREKLLSDELTHMCQVSSSARQHDSLSPAKV
jgi:hypothetical protein